MTTYLYLFFLFGACFGVATFSHRHLFNEGPHGAEHNPNHNSISSRVMWVLTCTLLWPVMALAGLNTAWVLAKRRRERDLKRR
jgi:hypothetical protein